MKKNVEYQRKFYISSISKIFFGIYLIGLWILFAFNSVNNDRSNQMLLYRRNVNGIIDKGVEYGYQFISYLCGKVNIDYRLFQIFAASVFLYVIGKFIYRHSANPVYVLLLYSLFPFILDTIQIRNSLAMCCILNGMVYVEKFLKDHNKKHFGNYIIWILVGAMFHHISLIYLIYLILLLPAKHIKIIVISGVVIEMILLGFRSNLLMFAVKFFPKVAIYIQNGLTGTQNWTKILFAFMMSGIFLIFVMSRKMNPNIEFVTSSYWLSFISFLFYILFIFDVDFFRIYRNLWLFFTIGISNALEKQKNYRTRVLYKIPMTTIYIFMNYFFIVFHSNNLKNILKYNQLWGGR